MSVGGEKIIGDDDDAFAQATSLKQLLVHREDVVYVPRQAQAATFNMRTWALNARATGNQLNGTMGGGNEKQSQRKQRQRQWAVDEGPTFVEDKPFFDYTFNHSSILRHREGCAVRPTHPGMLDTIRQHKPGAPANASMAMCLEDAAEAACDQALPPPPASAVQPSAASGSSLPSNRRLPHDVPKAFGATHHEALYNTTARQQRRLECAYKQMQAECEDAAYSYPRGDCLSRPDSPEYCSSSTSKPHPQNHSSSLTDFLVPAATSRPPSQQQQLPPLPDHYRTCSPLPTDGGPVDRTTTPGVPDCEAIATAITDVTRPQSHGPVDHGIPNASLRTRRCLQAKDGSRVRRYYGDMSMLYADARHPRGGHHDAPSCRFSMAPRARIMSGGGIERIGETAFSTSLDNTVVHGTTSYGGTVGEAPASYKYRSFGAVERFAPQPSQNSLHKAPHPHKSVDASPCDTPVPLYYQVPYAELLEEQQIIIEQRDIHKKAYETTKELYRQQTAYVAVAMEAMAEGDFLRPLPVTSSALADIPELELERMRLQVDTVPVMVMHHGE